MGYKVKRGPTPTNGTIKEMLTGFMKRMIVVLVLIVAMMLVGYFLFQFAYKEVPVFADAADDVSRWFKGFYKEYGIWATVGLILFICISIWAMGEEARKKERRKQAMNEMMK